MSPRAPRIRVAAVIPREDEVLLVRHRKGARAYWMLPGGGLDFGETFEACARRELLEETGFEVAIERMLYLSEAICPRGTRHVVNLFMLGKLEGGTLQVPVGDIIDEVAFVPIRQLHEITLYPAIAATLQASHASGYTEAIQNLGSFWLD